jgi:hypothetical protein
MRMNINRQYSPSTIIRYLHIRLLLVKIIIRIRGCK